MSVDVRSGLCFTSFSLDHELIHVYFMYPFFPFRRRIPGDIDEVNHLKVHLENFTLPSSAGLMGQNGSCDPNALSPPPVTTTAVITSSSPGGTMMTTTTTASNQSSNPHVPASLLKLWYITTLCNDAQITTTFVLYFVRG